MAFLGRYIYRGAAVISKNNTSIGRKSRRIDSGGMDAQRQEGNTMAEYQATIHTAEVTPILDGWTRTQMSEWASEVYEAHHPFINRISPKPFTEGYKLVLNLHRLDEKRMEDGRYRFEYEPLSQYEQEMEAVCDLLRIPGFITNRLDVCLDTAVPYEETEKLTRYIMLALAEEISEGKGWELYESIHPQTLQRLTTRAQNGDRQYKTREMEHYNRTTVDQSQYDFEVVNRFELRAMGSCAGKTRTNREIVEKWFERFKGLSDEHFEAVEKKTSEGLENEWRTRIARGTEDSATAFNFFLANNDEHVYTQRQMADLFERRGSNKANSKKFRQRGGRGMILYNRKQVREEVSAMKKALKTFLK